MAEPEEIPPTLQTATRVRRTKTWERLPAPRITRYVMYHLSAMSCQVSENEIIKAYSVAVKAYLARAGGPKVHEALRSRLRDQCIDEMHREIIDSMINSTRTLRPEVIDESKPYKLIHTTMQLKIKMITEAIVDKLKARLCVCGNELEEVDNDTYSPTVSALTHCLMLQLAVHDRMHIQMVDTKAAYLCQNYPQDATPLYVMLPKLVA